MVTSPDSACRETYQGDEALAGLLKKHQAHVNLTNLAALMAGVEAAPADERPDAWVDLVAENPSPALIAQLQAYRQAWAARQPQIAEAPIPARLVRRSWRIAPSAPHPSTTSVRRPGGGNRR